LHAKLKTAQECWKAAGDDTSLVQEVVMLAQQFGKHRSAETALKRLCREELELICFQHVSG
jgi:hypothetical protein